MLKASYPSAPKFKYITQTLAKITDEAPLYFTVDGLESRILSPDKTTMVVVKIPSIAFEEYDISEEVDLAVPVADLNRVVRRASRNDVLVFGYEVGAPQLKVALRNKKTLVERVFYVSARSLSEERVQEIRLDLGVTARFSADDYKQIMHDLRVIGEEVVFHYRDGKLYIYTQTSSKEYVGEFSEGSPLAYLSSAVEEAKSMYSLDLLEATLKPIGSAKYVTLSFDSNKPAKIEFEIGEGSYIVFWIAPRLEA